MIRVLGDYWPKPPCGRKPPGWPYMCTCSCRGGVEGFADGYAALLHIRRMVLQIMIVAPAVAVAKAVYTYVHEVDAEFNGPPALKLSCNAVSIFSALTGIRAFIHVIRALTISKEGRRPLLTNWKVKRKFATVRFLFFFYVFNGLVVRNAVNFDKTRRFEAWLCVDKHGIATPSVYCKRRFLGLVFLVETAILMVCQVFFFPPSDFTGVSSSI